MWPPGHLAFGYLLLVALDRIDALRPSARRTASGDGSELRSRTALPALALGTQFPDLVDKPLAWWLPVLPAGRSLAHSALAALVLLPIVAALCRRLGRPGLVLPFALGHLSHLAGDALWPLLTGAYAELGFLLWPLARRPPEELIGLGNYVLLTALSPYSLAQVALVVVALAVWWRGRTGRTADP